MHRDKRSAKLDEVRPSDRSLQPGAMMECRVSVTDGRMVSPEGEFEKVVVVVPDDGPFDINRIDRRRLRIERDFAKIRYFSGKRRSQVEIKLARAEPARGTFLVGR